MKQILIILSILALIPQISLSDLTSNANNKINIFTDKFNTCDNIFLSENENCKTNDQALSDNFDYFVSHFSSSSDVISSDNSNLKKEIDSSDYVPYKDFFYADWPRYTFNGEPALLESHIKPINTALILGAYSVIFYTQHSMQQNTIWKEVGPFQIVEDIKYALWVDKFGHFYGGYSTSYVLTEMLQLAGFSWETSTLVGGALGLSYMTYVEILDGYSVDFGFSPSDFYADVLGAGFFVAQYYLPVLQNFSPKFEYVNPKWLGERDRIPHDSFIDNYSSQSFWLSINVRNLIGGTIKEYIPKWLNLSVGYVAYSLCVKDWQTNTFPYPPNISHRVSDIAAGNRKIIIALDYDLAKLLPDGPPFWNWMKQSLNLFKLPSPAVEFSLEGKTKFYILYPFEFRFSGFRI